MITISPDGRSAYVADPGTSGVARFKRDVTTGELRPRGCVADTAHNNRGCAQTAPGLWSTQWVAVSFDGRSVYAAGVADDALVRFARNRTTGTLAGRGCVGDALSNPAGCATTAPGLRDVPSFGLTRDGRSLYAASVLDNSVVTFRRAA
jgi:DNA-binding beta-propeller fold protein YncE